MFEFVDTHCHIHFNDYALDTESVIVEAIKSSVTRMICVGCTLADSKLGIDLASKHSSVWASVGVHPHEAKDYVNNTKYLQELRSLVDNHAKKYIKNDKTSSKHKPDSHRKVVAIGEVGLDYYYNHSPKSDQKKMLKYQLELASEHDLPVIFHVREAFDDFFAIFDEFTGLKGVIHSFTGNKATLDKMLSRGLYIGLNGIMTFTKDKDQLEMAKSVPLDKLLLETDAPFLTPTPFRGTMCQPRHVVNTAEFLAKLRNESVDILAKATTANAIKLFRL